MTWKLEQQLPIETRGSSCALSEDMAESMISSASDSPLLLTTAKVTIVVRYCVPTLQENENVSERTNIFHKTAVRSYVLRIRDEIELEWVLLFAIRSNERLLFFDHFCGLGSKHHSGINSNARRLL